MSGHDSFLFPSFVFVFCLYFVTVAAPLKIPLGLTRVPSVSYGLVFIYIYIYYIIYIFKYIYIYMILAQDPKQQEMLEYLTIGVLEYLNIGIGI